MFRSYMSIALDEARAAAARGEVPVGAVIVNDQGDVIAKAGNRTREHNNPTAHAELLAIQEACHVLGQERLTGHDLYVTLEPCAMCAGAIAHARLRRLYFAASDVKSGGVLVGARVFDHAQCHHKPEIYDGALEQEATQMLKTFFEHKRS